MKNQVAFVIYQSKKFCLTNKSTLYSFYKRKLSSITQQQTTSIEDTRRRSIRSPVFMRYLWIRTALIHRSLHKIVEYIVDNSSLVL
jgi:hypothetical protein